MLRENFGNRSDERFVNLVVLKQIARDEESVDRMLPRQRQCFRQRSESRLAENAAGRAKLGKAGTKLPVGSMDEAEHGHWRSRSEIMSDRNWSDRRLCGITRCSMPHCNQTTKII